MSEWDTDFVRRCMSVDGIGAPSKANRNRFDRWLAAHDREVDGDFGPYTKKGLQSLLAR